MIIGNWEVNFEENKIRNRYTKEEAILFEPINFEEDDK